MACGVAEPGAAEEAAESLRLNPAIGARFRAQWLVR
jgi:hypothetical protein